MREHHGLLFGILSAISCSLMYVFVKLAQDIPVPTVVFFRFFIGLVLLLPWLMRPPVRFSFQHLPLHLVRDLSGLFAMGCYYYAIRRISLVNLSTLVSTFPLFIPLILLVWRKMVIPKQRILALLIGFVGVLVILHPTAQFNDVADLVALLGSFLSALAAVSIRKLSHIEPTHSILLNYFVLATVVALVPMVVFWQPIEQPLQWIYLGGVGVFGTLYQYFMTKSYTHAPISKAGMMSYFIVVFSGLFGWLLWNEVPPYRDALGVLLIIAGGCLALFDKGISRKLGKSQKL
jgi:drug/metabolite transporter (DMT)-like permease